ncbi:lipid A biosynthesis lauroyl acyltransferase [Neorhizobium sp. NCHU2750]|uniref:lysophospholipid acyltransferase family protein n=1 Tax=Neorhizobium sp. NCHU2750 TaxID=1825976 RepID=UPI000EB656E6|nr:lipid A biosynthesis lauroyl acyltransferase [Neorhizobium sp. NCHU2750]
MKKPGNRPDLKRKAWTYEATARPGLSALMREGPAGRQRFIQYWLRDMASDAGQMLLFGLFHLLPAKAVSDIGAFLGRHLIPRAHKGALKRARASLVALRPDADDATIDRWLVEYMESQGRQQAEYSVVQRLARRHGAIRHVGTGDILARSAGRPVIFVGIHTSNWEIMDQCLVDLGLDVTLNYDPPGSRSHHFIVRHIRRRGGLKLFSPGRAAVRPALRLLEQNGNVLIFCDEAFEGRMRAPFLGKPPHLKGNYALVARLARKTGALIWPVYMIRERGTQFTLNALEPFVLDGEADSEAQLLADVTRINAVVEPVIKAHPAQWYFLDSRLA